MSMTKEEKKEYKKKLKQMNREEVEHYKFCLLYTSDAADEL